MTQRKGISTGTTAQRTIEEAGKMRFNTTTSLLEYYDGNNWKSIDSPPTVSSVSPSNLISGDGSGNHTIVVTGSLFSTTVTAELITDGGTTITPDTTTRDSSSQVTLVVAKNKANLTNDNEPFDVKITNASGLAATLSDAINIDAQPVFVTAAGSLGTVSDSTRGSASFTIEATDPESGAVTFALVTGALPAGASLNTSTGVISGFDAVGSNTTSNFTIEARDAASNATERAFSITVNAPVSQSFTSSGTFSVPSGVTSVNVLVVAGGGSGGKSNPTSDGTGGGGAGGLIYRPGFTVTPGGTVSVTVGEGGPAVSPNNQGNQGSDSVFGTLTAKGGGGGGLSTTTYPDTNINGGSGGGAGGGGIGGTPDAGPGPNGTGQAGTANRGGGAGAAVRTGQVGAGGKGIVIVQY